VELVFGIAGIALLLVFVFLLFFVLGRFVRRAPRLKALGIVLGVLALVLVFRAFLPYSLIASLAGYVLGLALNVSPRILRRAYVLVFVTSIGVIVLDLLYDSGIVRFGIPAISQLFDPDLCFYAVTESLMEAAITAVAATVCFGVASVVVRLFSKDRSKRIVAYTSVVTGVMYLLEPQLHLRIQHPLVVHHPYFAFSTAIGLALGIWAGLGELPIPVWGRGHPILAVVAYFSLYHFVITVEEHMSSGSLFDVPYGTTMALTIAVTLPFGVMLCDLWRNRASSVTDCKPGLSGHSPDTSF